MALIVETREATTAISPSADHDFARGRRRDRSQTRASVGSIRTDESSTLRGRSRHRALSPYLQPSQSSTPALLSPTRKLLLQNRLRNTRREHCPSRKQSPTRQAALQRRQRSRSRSRGPRVDLDPHRPVDHSSNLRHEVLMDDGNMVQETKNIGMS